VQRRVVGSLATIESLLGEGSRGREPFALRDHRPDDIGG
jgi:hypothetical protein